MYVRNEFYRYPMWYFFGKYIIMGIGGACPEDESRCASKSNSVNAHTKEECNKELIGLIRCPQMCGNCDRRVTLAPTPKPTTTKPTSITTTGSIVDKRPFVWCKDYLSSTSCETALTDPKKCQSTFYTRHCRKTCNACT